MKLLSSLLISYRATAMRLLRKFKIILHITHCNTLNNFGHSLTKYCYSTVTLIGWRGRGNNNIFSYIQTLFFNSRGQNGTLCA